MGCLKDNEKYISIFNKLYTGTVGSCNFWVYRKLREATQKPKSKEGVGCLKTLRNKICGLWKQRLMMELL